MSRGVPSTSADELSHRVAVLRRFRELLVRQRERFQHYLAVLEKEQTVIESGDTEEILAHVELEEQIVSDIFSIQKVIDPLESMYRASGLSSPTDDIPALKTVLEDLKNQAVTRSSQNRELLSARMADVRTEITKLRSNPFAGSLRSAQQNSGALIDIEG
jgi:hypothetical protein